MSGAESYGLLEGGINHLASANVPDPVDLRISCSVPCARFRLNRVYNEICRLSLQSCLLDLARLELLCFGSKNPQELGPWGIHLAKKYCLEWKPRMISHYLALSIKH